MILRKNQPHVVLVVADGTHYGIKLECYESLLDAWKKGESFWEGVDNWEQPVVVKLAHVRMLFRRTPESIALSEAENEFEKKEALLKGDD